MGFGNASWWGVVWVALSSAEKQAAYRERKRLELEAGLPARQVDEDPAPSPGEAVEVEPEADEDSPALAMSLEAYVLLTVAESRRWCGECGFDAGRSAAHLRRAEAYARWRYQGVLVGRVGSL